MPICSSCHHKHTDKVCYYRNDPLPSPTCTICKHSCHKLKTCTIETTKQKTFQENPRKGTSFVSLPIYEEKETTIIKHELVPKYSTITTNNQYIPKIKTAKINNTSTTTYTTVPRYNWVNNYYPNGGGKSVFSHYDYVPNTIYGSKTTYEDSSSDESDDEQQKVEWITEERTETKKELVEVGRKTEYVDTIITDSVVKDVIEDCDCKKCECYVCSDGQCKTCLAYFDCRCKGCKCGGCIKKHYERYVYCSCLECEEARYTACKCEHKDKKLCCNIV